MNQKRDLLIKVLEKLKGYRNMSEDLLVLVNSSYCTQELIDSIMNKITVAIKIVKKEADIIEDIDNYFDALIPTNLRSEKHEQELKDIYCDITCKSMDTSGNLTMEYNPDSKMFGNLLQY